MKKTEGMKLIENGKRMDGRALDELREIKIETGVLERVAGSAYLEWGNNKVIAGVHNPREMHPKSMRDTTKAVLRCTYNMAPFSVDDRKRPGPDRRSVEISKVISDALKSVTILEDYPDSAIDIFIEILQADAGTRCAGLTAAAVAMADAGIPMKGLVSSCAAGRIDGEIAVDLMKDEDNYGESDLPLAIIPRKKEVVLLQMDGKLTRDEFKKAYKLAFDGAMKVYEIQKEALLSSMNASIGGD